MPDRALRPPPPGDLAHLGVKGFGRIPEAVQTAEQVVAQPVFGVGPYAFGAVEFGHLGPVEYEMKSTALVAAAS